MKRRYTEDVYNELVGTINMIDSDGVGTFSDIVGDIYTHFQRWLGILDVKHYLDDINTYQAKVLDANNTTIEDLNRIFGAVETVDFTYRDKMSSWLTCAESYQKSIQTLTGMLSGSVSFSKEKISAGSGALDKLLKETSVVSSAAASETYDATIKTEAIKAGKELIGDLLGIGKILTVDVLKFAKEPFWKWGPELANMGWSLINSVVAIGNDAGAIFALGLGYGLAELTGSGKYKKRAIDMASDLREDNDLHDYATRYAEQSDGIYAEAWETIATGAEHLDNTSDVYDTVSGTIEAFDGVINGDQIVAPEHQDKDYLDYVEDVFGLKFGEDGNDWIETANVWFNNGGVAWDYAEEALDADGNLIDGFFDNFKVTSEIKDTHDYVEGE